MKYTMQNAPPNNSRIDKLTVLAAALVFAAAQCAVAAPAQVTIEPVWPTKEWQTSTPEEQGMASTELARLVDFGRAHNLDSLLVVRHGKIVTEAYYAPYTAGIPHAMYSATKAVIGTLLAITCKEGLLDSPSHPVLDFFDRHGIANLDDRKAALTIQSLLDMTSGIGWTEPLNGDPVSDIEMERSSDWVKFILDRPMSSVPGSTFNYNSGNPHLLSAIITKITGMSALEYAKAKLFGPLGITDVSWQHDPQGISTGGYGLYLQSRDMAKIGYLYVRNGVWEGKQLVPTAWIDKVSHATVDMHAEWDPELRYSNLFWAFPGRHIYMAVGFHRQVIMVFPDLDVVAVTTGRDNYSLSQFADSVLGSVKSDTSLPADAAGAKLLADKIRGVSIERPSEIRPTSKMAAIISGKVYRFPPNEAYVKSLTLFLAGPQPHYEVETYAPDATKPGPRFVGPIGLDGLYRKSESSYQGLNGRYQGPPRVNAVKGTWQNELAFVVDRLVLGQGQPPELWTLTFGGKKLDVFMKQEHREITFDGETGG
jgi:CubicO group peptidase (beta-lactamase class C family)